MRTIIDLPPEQLERLDLLKSKENKSRASLIREAVAAFLNERSDSKIDMRESFGIWRNHPETRDALAYQQRIRSEWNS